MINIRKFRFLLFFLFFATALGLLLTSVYQDYHQCMAVSVIDESSLQGYTKDLSADLSNLLFCGEMVASDAAHQTIFISQSEDDLSHFRYLKGKLSITKSSQKLYFIENDELHNLTHAMNNGLPLRLAIVEGERYCEVQVVITSLPVVRLLTADFAGFTLHGFPITQGTITLFAGHNQSTGGFFVDSYPGNWHVRGMSSASLDKAPLKLSLKDTNGVNIYADWLGLGSDDDWILNSMARDDTKMREKIAMDAWNQYIASTRSDMRMSSGEYVEVVIDDAYYGLCLLQRRIDEKYLELDKSKDILFKGHNIWVVENYRQAYALTYSPKGVDETYDILADAFDNARFDIENLIDANLLVHFASAADNAGYKNMFYVLRPSSDGYKVHFIPWDTDCSMGIVYRDDSFIYDYQYALEATSLRLEYRELLPLHPELFQMCADRWKELRTTMYSEQTLEALIERNIHVLQSSGAFNRDAARWGFWSENDTWDELIRWCREHLVILDEYYQ